MSDQRLFFGAFTVERRYDAAPDRVFRALADRDVKQRWLGCEEVGRRTDRDVIKVAGVKAASRPFVSQPPATMCASRI